MALWQYSLNPEMLNEKGEGNMKKGDNMVALYWVDAIKLVAEKQ